MTAHTPVTGVRLVLVLTENHTLVEARDLRGLVTMAVQAEEAGIDAVMCNEHVVLGPSAARLGVMRNPRDYAAPGNQEPATAWPSSLVLLSAIAARTTRLRLAAAAVIAPLRHPLLLAKELGTLDLLSRGRLVVLPSVSWHAQEYDALGVPFRDRGRILDEQLDVLSRAWGGYPLQHEGRFYSFGDVWLEPGAWSPDGPTLWFGGQGMHAALARRLAKHGHGLNPFGPVSDADLEMLAAELRAAGRSMSELELVGGIRGRFAGSDDLADLGEAIGAAPGQVARGFGSICVKPSMFLDDAARFPAWCRELVARVEDVTGLPVVTTPPRGA
jgi:alkanesulfonate monooxygenase SsuD/methylene tetrahydromethanopterin reductase-like flavin-dependent oxidoreductase (luciferase family)